MSTAALSRTIEEETLVSAAHVHDLIAENARLQRDLTSARASRATLFKQLNLAVDAGTVVNSFIHEGCLTVVLSTGAVRQLQSTVRTTPTSTEFGSAWVELPAVPGTAAACRDRGNGHDVTDIGGMACIADDEQVAS